MTTTQPTQQQEQDFLASTSDPIAHLLIPRHLAHIRAINARDWSLLASYQWHVSASFTADIMYSSHVRCWDDYVAAFWDMTNSTTPEFQIGVLDVNVSVRERKSEAEVYLLATEEGRAPGVVSHAMSKLVWKKAVVGGGGEGKGKGEAEWFLCSHTMFRGVT